MKKILISRLGLFIFLFHAFLLTACVRPHYATADMDTDVFQNIGVSHNDVLDSIYDKVVVYKKSGSGEISKEDVCSIAGVVLSSFGEGATKSVSVKYLGDGSVNVANSEYFSQTDTVMYAKYSQIFDDCTSLDDLISKLKNFEKELDGDVNLNPSRKSYMKSGISVAISSVSYWKENYQKWYNIINVSEKEQLTTKAQPLHGIVMDSYGEPLPGATIRIKGTTKGAVADLDGKFILQDFHGVETICVSFIGFEPQEIRIRNRYNVVVVMKEDVMEWWNPIAEAAKADGIGAVAAAIACVAVGPFDAVATTAGAVAASLTDCLQKF